VIAIVGDLFSVWFRNHARNAKPLRQTATRRIEKRSRTGCMWPVSSAEPSHFCFSPLC